MAVPMRSLRLHALTFAGLRFVYVNLGHMFMCVLASLLLPTAKAQMFTLTDSTATPMPGAGHDYIHLLNETVNPANGSVSININFPMPKGRGLSLPFSISYNSGQVVFIDPFVNSYSLQPLYSVPSYYGAGVMTWESNVGLLSSGGWSYGVPTANWAVSTGPANSSGHTTDTCSYSSGYTFTDSTGGAHFLGMGTAGNFQGNDGSNTQCFSSPTQGGDDYYSASLGAVPPGGSVSNPLTVVDSVLGTTYKFGSNTIIGSTSGTGLLPTLIEDRNGNQITPTQSKTSAGLVTFSFKDTLGRTVLSDAGFQASPEIINAGGLGYQVQWRTTSANYTPPSSANLGQVGGTCTPVRPVNISNLTVIHSITLANGQAYHFYYGDDNPNGLNNPYGLISEIDYPDGGWVRYTWKPSDTYSEPADFASSSNSPTPYSTPDGCQFQYSAPVVATRTVGFTPSTTASIQTYTYSTIWDQQFPIYWDSKSTHVVTNDAILGLTASKQYTYIGVEAGLPAYSQSHVSPQVPVEQTVTTYDWGSSPTPLSVETKAWYDQYQLACDFTTLPSSLTSGHFYQYGPGVQITDDKEYGFGQIATAASTCTGLGTNISNGPVPTAPTSPTPARETTTAYQTFTSPLGAVFTAPQSTVTYGNGTAIAETDYGYDTVPVSTVSAVQHDETNYSAGVAANRANMTSVTRKCLAGCTTDAVTTAAYDETGQMVSTKDGCGNAGCSDMTGTNHTTMYSYADSPSGGNAGGNSNAYLTQITDPLGHIQSSTYNYATGELASATDQNNNTTNYTYNDLLYRLTQVQGPPNSNNGGQRPTTVYCYYDVAPTSSPCPNSVAPPPSVTTTTIASPDPNIISVSVRDGMGHVVQSQISSDPAGADLVDTVYNGVGGVYSVSNPYRSGTSPTDPPTSFIYNSLGQKVIETSPDGSMKQWCYNGVASQGQTNCRANASSITTASWVDYADESQLHRQSISDSFGRLTAQMETNPATGALCAETDYTYDALNNLSSAIQNGTIGEVPRSRGFHYDSLSRLTSSTNPETGTIGYKYDANSNLSTKTDARGTITSYGYDAMNRVLSKGYSDGTPTALYGYDGSNASGTSQVYSPRFEIGKLSASSDGPRTERQYGYDEMGRLTLTTSCTLGDCSFGSGSGAWYDLAGNPILIEHPDQFMTQQTYDGAGRLASVVQVPSGRFQGNQTFVKFITYNPDGSPSVMKLGNLAIQNMTKNNRLQVQAMTATSDFFSTPLLWHQYCYVSGQNCPAGGSANNGNIWSIVDILNTAKSQIFGYDSLNRVTGFATNGVSQSFAIDSFGNMSPLSGSTPVNTFDPATNRISNLPCAAYLPGFDAAGNQLCTSDQSASISQYAFDAENRPTAITTLNTSSPYVTYTYDGEGQRLRKQFADGTALESITFNGQVVSEQDENGWTDYVYANGSKIAKLPSTDNRLHTQGTFTSGGNELRWNLPLPTNADGSTYIVRAGDLLCFRQYNSNAVGGPIVAYWESQSSTAWRWSDTNGATLNQFTPQNVWANRCVDMTMGGATIGQQLWFLGVLTDVWTGPGTWDIWYADMSIKSLDGTVIPVNLSAPSATPFQGSGWTTPPVAFAENAPTVSDPTGLSGASTHYYLADHLGTAQLEFASGGWPVWQGQFSPFGQELDNQPTTNTFKFTGKERDTESGLDYFGARYYGSNMGRFQSPDNGEDQDIQDPQSWNLYPYARNNPVTNTDPDGHDCVVQSRTSDTTESVSVSAGTCAGVKTGSGQSATYVPGTVTGITANGGNSIDIGYKSYDGQSSGVTNSRSAPAFDHPGIDGPANAAIFGQIGNQGMGAIKAFTVGSVAIGGTLGLAGVPTALLGGAEAASVITEEATVLARAGSAVGNQGAKVASRETAEAIAKRWVGEGGRQLTDRTTGKVIGEISADGSKVARYTSIDKAQPYINLVNRITGSNLHVGW